MTRWKVLTGVGMLVLALAIFGVAMGNGANPCDTPAGARNPNCVDGEFRPPGRGLDHGEEPGDPDGLLNRVTIDPPSSAAGTYQASGANFGPALDDTGVSGAVVLVNDGSAAPTLGCNPLVGFPAGAIALIDRGVCTFVQKVNNAQAAGAVAVIVVNNIPGDPITLGGADPNVTIPSVMVSLVDGNTIKAGLPATGTVSRNP
jgi:hypothetical protein